MEAQKLIVLIPTRDRPAYLNLTVESVLEQAKRFGHKNVHVVISDTSNSDNAAQNAEFMRRLEKRFPGTPIHYYAPGSAAPIERLLVEASPEEKKAAELLMPKDGHYGAHRNRLTLLGIYHGGPKAAYLHLDDDTPLMAADSKAGTLSKNPEDVLGAFKAGYRKAVRQGKEGFHGLLFGVPDATVSVQSVSRPSELRKYLKVRRPEGGYFRFSPLSGPARVLGSDAVRLPYIPYGRDEDWRHYGSVQEMWNSKGHGSNAAGSRPFSRQRGDSNSPMLAPLDATAASVVHIGIHGPRPSREKTWFRFEMSKKLEGNWARLADRMMRLKRH